MVSSWNRLPVLRPPARQVPLVCRYDRLPRAEQGGLLAHGNGRSYGDVCLNEDGTLLMARGLDRFIDFDPASGRLVCEAGVLLADILELIVSRGWFLPVTPGTRMVTVGGAIANDVHGKNHHDAGTFGDHVRAISLRRSSGQCLELNRTDHPELFAATVGGLGLTGLIVAAELQLVAIDSPFMQVQSQRFANLDEFFAINAEAEKNWPYTVAWVDCLGGGRGRGIYFSARHIKMPEKPPHFRDRQRRMPVDPPFSLVNGLSLKLFNSMYYHQPLKAEAVSHYQPYFYPLDGLLDWNRIYGRRGFYQYQCVLPPENRRQGVQMLLDRIADSGQGSFLAVLKTFADRPSPGMLSFARPGVTLALDFPNLGERTLALFASLDSIVTEAGGALYPAKDARMSAAMFQRGFPRWDEFAAYIDPAFSSSFWRRVTE